MTERPPLHVTYMQLAETWARQATCCRAQVGCVLVDADRHVIASGFNGAPRGLPHCEVSWEHKDADHCQHSLHAEMNALLQCARVGVSCRGASLYTTHLPCRLCAMMIVQVGIVGVMFAAEYGSDPGLHVLRNAKLEVAQYNAHTRQLTWLTERRLSR